MTTLLFFNFFSPTFKVLQGDPNQKLQLQMAVPLKLCIFDPMLVKPKCVQGVADFFKFSAACLQFSAVCLQFPKISATLQTTFGLYNMGSKMHSFRGTAIWSCNFWFGSPCTMKWSYTGHETLRSIQIKLSLLWSKCSNSTLWQKNEITPHLVKLQCIFINDIWCFGHSAS